MYTKETTVCTADGLKGRPATFFVQKTNEFKSSVWIEVDDSRANAKSLLGVLALGVAPGTQVKLIASGPDEQEAVEAVASFLGADNGSL